MSTFDHHPGATLALFLLAGCLCQAAFAVDICKDQSEDGTVRFVQCQLLDAETAAGAERLQQPENAKSAPRLGPPYRWPHFDFSLSPPAGFEHSGWNRFARPGTHLKLQVMEIPVAYRRAAERMSRGKDHSNLLIDGRQARLIRVLHQAPADSGYPDFRELKLLVGDQKRTVILIAVAPDHDRTALAAYLASFHSLRFDD